MKKEPEFPQIPQPKRRKVLAAMARTCNLLRACQIADVDPSTHYHWMREDPVYAAAFEIAKSRGADMLEAEAVRRAYQGIDEPVFNGGKRAMDFVFNEDGTVKMQTNPDGSLKLDADGLPMPAMIPAAVRKYSDTLLIFLMKGAMPDKYRERWTGELTGKDGKPLLDLASVRAFMREDGAADE